jgi:hypothetical protein
VLVFTDFAAEDEQFRNAVTVEMEVSATQKQIENKDT